jgi:TDG/mug DNA glycosylase family protein
MDLDTLPDILDQPLRLLSIGLNPSLPSVAAGFYFANPRNRFWKALNASALVEQPLTPGAAALRLLCERQGIGFTDLVKRPTRGAAQLRAADYRAGVDRLQRIMEDCGPALAWFHGKLAYRQFCRYSGIALSDCDWGLQPLGIAGAQLFVTPNPSPANAAYSLGDIVAWYNRLARRLAAL